MVYSKVPYLAHSFLLSTLLLLARWSQKIPSNIICTLMTPSCYISFTSTNSSLSLNTLTTTFTDILSWMNLNKLLLNPSKTEFLLIGTKQQRLKFSDLTNLSLSNDIIPVSFSARNLGFIFDSDMSLILWSNQLCIQILSFSHPRHPSNLSSSFSFCCHCSRKLTCLQQTWLL